MVEVVVEVVVEEGRVFSWEVVEVVIGLEEGWEVVEVVRLVTIVVSGDVGEVSFCCCEVVGEVVDSFVEMAGSGVVPKGN